MKGTRSCSLCGSKSELQRSHIIPRSYFKSLKGKSGQLFMVSSDESVKAQLINADPKERLLCRDCEQHICIKYERYGTRLLKDKSKAKRSKDFVVFEQFRFKEFYLYLISIFWRVSISSLPRYAHIELGEELNNLLQYCLKENTIKIKTSLRLDHFFRISVIRIVDKSGQLDDLSIKKTMFDFNFERGDTPEKGLLYYFVVDGFLIIYRFSPEEDIHEVRTKRNYAQITNKQRLLVPISDITNFKQLIDGFNSLTTQAVEHNSK